MDPFYDICSQQDVSYTEALGQTLATLFPHVNSSFLAGGADIIAVSITNGSLSRVFGGSAPNVNVVYPVDFREVSALLETLGWETYT